MCDIEMSKKCQNLFKKSKLSRNDLNRLHMNLSVYLQNLGALEPSGVPQMAFETRMSGFPTKMDRRETRLERVRPGPFWIDMNPKSIIGDRYD